MAVHQRLPSTRTVVSAATGVQDSTAKRYQNVTRPPPSLAGVTTEAMRDPSNIALRFNQLASEVHRASEIARSSLTSGAQSVEGLKFTNGSPLVVSHGLNQSIIGWQIARPRGPDRILDIIETSSSSTQITLLPTVGTIVQGSFAPQSLLAPINFTGYGYTSITRTGTGAFAITVAGLPSVIAMEASLQMSGAIDLKLIWQPTTTGGGNTTFNLLSETGNTPTDISANASNRIFFKLLLNFGGCTADMHIW